MSTSRNMLKQFFVGVLIYVLAIFVYHMNTHAAEPATPATKVATEAKPATPATASKPAAATEQNKKGFKKMYAVFETSLGKFKVLLHHALAPKTVENFVGLAEGTKDWFDPQTRKSKKGTPFYDGLIFHRVIKKFMIQGGDPTGTGMGGPGYPPFADEFHANLNHDKPGILSMANAGPNTNGSQFFITLAPTPHLNKKHSVFGEVVEGMDVVQAIGVTKTDPSDRPQTPVVMKKVTIVRE